MSSKKSNPQLIFNIITIISLLINIFLIWAVFRIGNHAQHAIEKDTHGDIILRTKIECIKNPSETCEKEIQRTEKNLQDLIDRYYK